MRLLNPETKNLEEAVIARAALLATPVDIPALIADGTLVKRGAWYEVLRPDRLPEHARAQIETFSVSHGRRLVKLPRSYKRAARLHARLKDRLGR